MNTALEITLRADTKDEMIKKLEKSISFIKENYTAIKDEEEDNCEECDIENELGALVMTIMTLAHYRKFLPRDITEAYNEGLKKCLTSECHCDEDEEDADNTNS